MSRDDLQPDPNYPGLYVCQDDLDQLDPYRLPARETENITMEWCRPDISLGIGHLGICTEDDNDFMITEDGQSYMVP